MPKLSETYSKWKSIGEGLLAIVLGLLLIRFGQVIPRVGYQLLMGYFSLSAVWHLLTRWFQDKQRRENIFVTLGKLVVAALLFDSIILQDLTLYLLVFIIASYQLFTGVISLVTWFLYRKNAIHPRLHHFFDAVWMIGFGLYSISPFHDAANFELLLLGFYLLMLGASSLRDGFFFEKIENNPKLKRRMRMTLPIFVTALIPISTLRKLNEWLSNHESQEGKVHSERKTIRWLIWKFLSIPQKHLSSLPWGMWIFAIKGRLFPMARMILTRSVYSAWLEMVSCLKPIGKNTSSSVREKVRRPCLLMV